MSLLEFQGVERRFPVRRGLLDALLRREHVWLHAVRGVDLAVRPGEILGIVGESGCGKSTLARIGIGLQPADAGAVIFDGAPLNGPDPKGRLQMVFQDPYSSLNPRMTIGAQLEEVVAHYRPGLTRAERQGRVARMLDEVGLVQETAQKFPHALSGGQRQRVSIARALCPDPQVLIADEPVSALDASVQAQIINLLRRLNREKGLTIVFISHDMNVVRYLCDRVAVMYLGEVVELNDSAALFAEPRHPYTRALIGAVPDVHHPHREGLPVRGEIPDPFAVLQGCRFAPRCPLAETACHRPQSLDALASGGAVRCWKAVSGTLS
ncbi:ABC transporter ATP-binding protein [Paenirhodobacter populi]|uniref:ABC transporter ATP-binding protein n=1 Tax=Paenirhodobacter populi TaxID=2306993 RepID=A0A443J4A3_9RHOB|nr:ABC transporter ATP-binding protein [Sinirhodobacter populi]RWR15378.1 ABC transporter ATP-binding protein [Sinirhodobacter populi]RWR21440.1 ABC transporter ATP-binding protein [Sinirhodobacter populi]